jgi:hypothetical protein
LRRLSRRRVYAFRSEDRQARADRQRRPTGRHGRLRRQQDLHGHLPAR